MGNEVTLSGTVSSFVTGAVVAGLFYGADKLIGKGLNFIKDKVSSSAKPSSLSNPKNVVQYDKLKASYASDEIVNANRVGSGLKGDPYHRSASFLSREQLANGKVTSFRGEDGISRHLLQTRGGLNGKTGIFEYIVEPNGTVSHQMFIPKGNYTGYANQFGLKGGY